MASLSSGDSLELTAVLRRYPIAAQTIVHVRAAKSGLSGARVWRLERSNGEPLCLRRWSPEDPSPERLRLIHGILAHLAAGGIAITPVPIESTAGETFVWHDATHWELTNWLPGMADYRTNPVRERLVAAMHALARLHLRAAAFAGCSALPAAVSPGIGERAGLFSSYRSVRMAELRSTVDSRSWPELAERAEEIISHFVRNADWLQRMLDDAGGLRVSQQPCIRDIHDEHVLFEGNSVSGIIDFGAMRYDNVATDIARLLGSMARENAVEWRAGLAAYREARPLSSDELTLISAFDASGILLGSVQWIDWIGLQRRQFSDRAVVLERIDRLLSRLRRITPRVPWKSA
jgi:homoserine kinase type II